jgi:hypothetical protein
MRTRRLKALTTSPQSSFRPFRTAAGTRGAVGHAVSRRKDQVWHPRNLVVLGIWLRKSRLLGGRWRFLTSGLHGSARRGCSVLVRSLVENVGHDLAGPQIEAGEPRPSLLDHKGYAPAQVCP